MKSEYTEWEDFQAGMYRMEWDNETELKNKSIELLSDSEKFMEVMKKILIEWPVSCDENLSNSSCNRRAWLGQAACCYSHGCPELLTRKAWAELSYLKQYKANRAADSIIKTYETRSKRIHSEVEKDIQGNSRRSTKEARSTEQSPFVQTGMFGYP